MKNAALLVAGALALPFAAAAQAYPGTAGQSSSAAVYTSTATPPFPIATGRGNSVRPSGQAVWSTGYTHIGTGAAVRSTGYTHISTSAATTSGATPAGPTSSSSPPPLHGAGSKNAASGLLAGGVAVLAALAL
jgi:hypothetical protein